MYRQVVTANTAPWRPGVKTIRRGSAGQFIALHTDEAGDHETLIADMYTNHNWAKANARLLRAAPGLLPVAQLALDYLDGQEYAQACAIIARATGG